MMEKIGDGIHQCEGCRDAMGPAILCLCLSSSLGCWLALGWPWLRLCDHFGFYQICFGLFHGGLVPFSSWLYVGVSTYFVMV